MGAAGSDLDSEDGGLDSGSMGSPLTWTIQTSAPTLGQPTLAGCGNRLSLNPAADKSYYISLATLLTFAAILFLICALVSVELMLGAVGHVRHYLCGNTFCPLWLWHKTLAVDETLRYELTCTYISLRHHCDTIYDNTTQSLRQYVLSAVVVITQYYDTTTCIQYVDNYNTTTLSGCYFSKTVDITRHYDTTICMKLRHYHWHCDTFGS